LEWGFTPSKDNINRDTDGGLVVVVVEDPEDITIVGATSP